MKELISIIIPYFKKKKYLEKTIQSVVKQTYQKFEVILIYDDIDNSDLKFVKYTLRKIKNKKIIINKKNLGVGMSRNLGIKIAQGKFIAFLDADDTWHKDKIKEQVIYMKKNKVDFSYSSYAISDKNMKMLKMIKAPKKVMFKDEGKNILDEIDYDIIKKFGFYNFFDQNRNYMIREQIEEFYKQFIKEQIVEIGEKDLIGAWWILHESKINEVFSDDGINLPLLSEYLSSDWGFYHTVINIYFAVFSI